MFGLFKSKDQGPKLTHFVYLNKAGKFRMMIEELSKATSAGGKAMLIYHFDETGLVVEALLKAAGLSFNNQNTPDNKILLVKSDHLPNVVSDKNNACIFAVAAEIHPISGKDELIHTTIHQFLPNIHLIFYTSTDSPIMKMFGGDKVYKMMINMGMDENERIEHSMISSSIARAQEKIKAKVLFEKPATSKQEWIDLNVKT